MHLFHRVYIYLQLISYLYLSLSICIISIYLSKLSVHPSIYLLIYLYLYLSHLSTYISICSIDRNGERERDEGAMVVSVPTELVGLSISSIYSIYLFYLIVLSLL